MSGWTTVTVDARDETAAEQLREAFDTAASDEYDGSRGDEGATVEALMWGYGSGTTMSVLKDNADLWDSAVVMNCNDTSDSGSGTAYVSEGGTVSSVDSASGAERAMGHDAADRLQHHVSSRIYMR
jgi:hypothetical protein